MEHTQTIKPNSTQPEDYSDMTFSLDQSEKQKALSGVIARIGDSLDIDTIFKITVTEVRQLLKSDRVAVFRFYPELGWEGEFIHEDVGTEWVSALAGKLQYAEEFARLYQQGQIHATSDIHQAGVSDCHVQILERFQVRANIVVPLMKGKNLWGLLCIHQCSDPRQWEESEIEFVQLIAGHLGVALQQADYLEQVKIQSAELAQAKAREKAGEWQRVIAIAVEKIRQSLDIESIFRTSTAEIRQLLNSDRVGIYRFNPDWSGEFVFESVAEGWISLVNEQSQQAELNANISECSLKELAATPVIDSYLQDTEGGRFARGEVYRVCHDIYDCGFTSCYLKVLESYQAKAYVIIAIYHGQKLWGLLSVYQNTTSRHWQEDEVYFLTQISTQLGVALQQAELLQQTQHQAAAISKAAERQRALANTVEKIRQSLDIDTIFKTTTQEVRGLLEVERVAIYRFYPDWSGEFVADSILDGWTLTAKTQPIRELVSRPENQSKKYPRHEIFVPISQGEKLWGLLVAYQNSQPRYWQDEEINLLAQVGIQLGVALQQAEALKQVQMQAEQLAKAAERERKATAREKALALTVEKIRQSLDLNTIFVTSTQEVQQLLEVDQVTIYRFHPDWSGEFVAESVTPGWKSLRRLLFVISNEYLQQNQGGDFAKGEILVVKDIYENQDVYQRVSLSQFMEARSYMIVPIFQGDKLWGLLAAYHNTIGRDWQKDEIDLLVQIGNQLAVGVQQAELLEQTQSQKEELRQTLKELQQSQSQLIQSEKMAGLGQLVAGIAHEINNPISFIFGNITYASEYAENLLKLLQIYQKFYPNPEAEIKEQSEKLDIDFIADDLPKMLTSMKMGADRISQLVLSLRTFARLDEADMKPVQLHEGIESTLLILQHRLLVNRQSLPIEVIKEYGNLPRVVCYAAQMNQVFMNILNNAIDALEDAMAGGKMADRPKIWIWTQVTEHNSIQIRITDNGNGIAEDVRSRIFEPFFTTKQLGKGTGLGLFISYQIVVDKHGGQLKCVSQLGKGCEILIEIPM